MPKNIYHNHHIIPKHAGGTDHPDNLVRLTVPEHAEVHRKLYEEFGHWQDKIAWQGLSGHIGKEEIIRQKNIQQRLGKTVSKETRTKMSDAHRGKIVSTETRAKMSAAHRDKIVSAETRAKMSDFQKGKIVSAETRAKISVAMKRYHFDKCKEIS